MEPRYTYETADQVGFWIDYEPYVGFIVVSRSFGDEDRHVEHFKSRDAAEAFIDGAVFAVEALDR